MAKKELTLEQKKLDTDLWIIVLATFIIYGIYKYFGDEMMSLVQDNSVSIFLRLFVSAALQFGIAGLGITIVSKLRRERFSSYGLKRQNSISTIVLSVLCFVPYFLLMLLTGQIKNYTPFSIMITDDILARGLLVNILGIVVIAIVWGFFEGFNYVVISDKISKRYPSKTKWFDWGALTCALICVLFHPFNISILGLLEIACTFFLIYGMLLVKKYTNNAWGCVFIFMFLWNAF